MNVFSAISKQMNWVGQRYAVAASNVANLDTPGYRAREISDFKLALDRSKHTISVTHPQHLKVRGQSAGLYEVREQHSTDETHSANNVSLEREMQVIGESSKQMSTNASLYKLFHRMALASAKG